MSIQWINVKDTPPPTDKDILIWTEQTTHKDPSIAHVWYGSNTDNFYDGDDKSKYILDKPAWRVMNYYEDNLTNQCWYEEAPPFEWYSLINSPEEV